MSNSLPAALRRVLLTASTHHHLLIACDFDGTLAPFTTNPSEARMLPEAASALQSLAQLSRQHPERLTVALVSGRQLDVLAELAQPAVGTHLIGSHGAQVGWIEAGGHTASGKTVELSPDQRQTLTEVRRSLVAITERHPGCRIEDKELSVALHTRGTEAQTADAALAAARDIVKDHDVEVLLGNQVIEYLVVHATKGTALTNLRANVGANVVVYLGDDVTDETAFAELDGGRGDVGIKVGTAPTVADYRVHDEREVAGVLELLLGDLELSLPA